MTLDSSDVELFFTLHCGLLAHVNNALGICDRTDTIDELRDLDVDERVKIRNALYENIELVDLFAKENPFDFSENELQIVSKWRHFVRGKFIIVRYLKKHAAFLTADSPSRVYGVVALQDPLEDVLGPPPAMAETVLLPFKDKIIYDGMLQGYRVSFGSGIRRRFSDQYQKSKAAHGIITSLPFSGEATETDKQALLKYYLRNQRTREYYSEEISDLIEDDHLARVYHAQMGRASARSLGRRLKELGIRDAWFGILEGLIVAAGTSKTECRDIAQKILPEDRACFVYYYRARA